MEENVVFESWAIVELFGRQQIAGKMSEQLIAGKGFVRVDVPAVNGIEPFTRFFGPDAIYSIIPTTEEIATGVANKINVIPIQPFLIPSTVSDEVSF